MRALRGGIAVLITAGLTLTGCGSAAEHEWRVAGDANASTEDIIDAGHAVGVATSGDQMVVTWEVEPEDDEGPYQGAWRLYDRRPLKIADGTFGTVRESSARIAVTPVDDGFLLTDYKKHRMQFLNRTGELAPAVLRNASAGSPLAGGVLLESDADGPRAWQVLLPEKRQLVALTALPTEDVQGIALTADGTVWVLLPRKDGGPFRLAHAKDGTAPWTTESIPLPNGVGARWDGFSASGERLFVVGSRSKDDRESVDVIMSRTADETEWTTIDGAGIPGNLTGAPRVTVLPKGRLLATSGGEGNWVWDPFDLRFRAIGVPRTNKHSRPTVTAEGRWLWSAEQSFGTSLHYSDDFGETWRPFNR